MNLDDLRLWVALFLILFPGSCVLKTYHHLVIFREAQKVAELTQSKKELPSNHQGEVR